MKRGYAGPGFLKSVFVILLLSAFLWPMSGVTIDKDTWEWTAENPKPMWFNWGKDYWPTEPVRGGILKLAAARYIGLMNPNHWPVNDWNAMTYMYDYVMCNDGEFKPSFNVLAESWRFKNPQTVIMKLRPGVKFHDGSDFNAEAYMYQMNWLLDKKNGAWSRAWLEPVQSTQVLDEYTVQFNFKRAWAGFPGVFSTVPGWPISAEALKKDVAIVDAKRLVGKVARAEKKLDKAEKKAEKAAAKGGNKAKKAAKRVVKTKKELVKLKKGLVEAQALAKGAVSVDKHAVGTGKYMFDDGSPGNYLKLKRNPNWWFGLSIGRPEMPYPDGVLITVIPDPSIQLANLRANKIHSIIITKAQYAMIKNDRNIITEISTWPHLFAMKFNTVTGPCKDIRVRKAISHAIDRDALVAGIQFGLATVAAGMYPIKHWAHNPELKPVKYDPELSKKLLAEAGYDNGLTIGGYVNNLSEITSTAQAIQNMLNKVGINWKVDLMDLAGMSARMRNAEFDMSQGGWAYIWDPDIMATGLFHPDGGFNFGRSNNQDAIKLIMAGKSETNFKKRQQIYRELEKLIYDDYQSAWLWYPKSITAHSKTVAGYNAKYSKVGLEAFYQTHPLWVTDGK